MGYAKRVLAAVSLIVIIVGVVIWLLIWAGVGSSGIPKHVREQGVEMADIKSLEVITLPAEKWAKMLGENGKYRNPKTGEYTMVPVMTCAACGEKIPKPDIPPDASPADFERYLMEYKCPKCGEPAMGR